MASEYVLELDIVHREGGGWSGHLHLPGADDFVQVAGRPGEGAWTDPDWQTDARLQADVRTSSSGEIALVRAFAEFNQLTGKVKITDEPRGSSLRFINV